MLLLAVKDVVLPTDAEDALASWVQRCFLGGMVGAPCGLLLRCAVRVCGMMLLDNCVSTKLRWKLSSLAVNDIRKAASYIIVVSVSSLSTLCPVSALRVHLFALKVLRLCAGTGGSWPGAISAE